MKNLVSWVAIALSVVAIALSLWPEKIITAEKVVLKDKNGVIRGILDADSNVIISLFSENEKEMFRITALSDGAQIDMHGSDARQRVRLSTWGGNYLSIMDKSWNKRINVGDIWYLIGNNLNRGMGMLFEKDGKLEEVFEIQE